MNKLRNVLDTNYKIIYLLVRKIAEFGNNPMRLLFPGYLASFSHYFISTVPLDEKKTT